MNQGEGDNEAPDMAQPVNGGTPPVVLPADPEAQPEQAQPEPRESADYPRPTGRAEGQAFHNER